MRRSMIGNAAAAPGDSARRSGWLMSVLVLQTERRHSRARRRPAPTGYWRSFGRQAGRRFSSPRRPRPECRPTSWVANRRRARPSLPDLAICVETCSASIDRHMSPAIPCPKTSPVSFGSISPTNEFSIMASNWVFAWPSLSGPPGAAGRCDRMSAAFASGAVVAPVVLAARSRSAAKSAAGAFEPASALSRWAASVARDGSAALATSRMTSVRGLKAIGRRERSCRRPTSSFSLTSSLRLGRAHAQ